MSSHPSQRPTGRTGLAAAASRRPAALCAVLAVLLLAHAVVSAVVAVGLDGADVEGWRRAVPVGVDLAGGLAAAGLALLATSSRSAPERRERLTAVVIVLAVVAAAVRGVLLEQPHQFGEIGVLLLLAGAVRFGRAESEEALAARREVQEANVRDSLTHCANRQGLEMVAAPIIDHARREGQALHCLVVDVDGFAAVNETAGLVGGDTVLVAVADALQAGVRGTDVVARWHADRFVVFGPGTGTSPLELERRVQNSLQTDPPLPGTAWSERVSIGSATLVPWDEGDLDSLVKKGEQDLALRRSLRRRAGLVAEQAGVTPPPVAESTDAGGASTPS